MNKLENRILELVEQITGEPLEQGEQVWARSFEELRIDSLMALELAVHLEREYSVYLSEEELEGLRNLRDVVEIVQSRRG